MWGVMHPSEPATLPAIPSRPPAGVGIGRRRRNGSSALESPGVLHRALQEEPASNTKDIEKSRAYTAVNSPSTGTHDPREEVVKSAIRMADDAKKTSAAATEEARERCDSVARRVEAVSTQIAALQRALAGATARVDGEIDAAKKAIARCVARADSANSALSTGIADQFRGELGALELRLSTELAKLSQEVSADESRAREHLAAALTDNTRRVADEMEARIQRLETALQQQQNALQSTLLREPPKASSPVPQVSNADLAEAEGRMRELAKASAVQVLEEVARASAAAAERDGELMQRLENETAARVSMENTVSTTIEAAVRGVARATQRELVEVGERIDQIDDARAGYEKATQRETKSRFAAVEADLRDLRGSRLAALQEGVESTSSETRRFCEDAARVHAERVSTTLDEMSLRLENLKKDIVRSHESVVANATVARMTDRALATEATSAAVDSVLKQTASDIETARRDCHRDAIAHARRERRGVEEYCESRSGELSRRIDQCEAAVASALENTASSAAAVASAAEREDGADLLLEERCLDKARAIATVISAQLADDVSAVIRTELDPLKKAVRSLEAHVDLQSKEILSLRRDLEDYDADRTKQIEDERDQVDALAAATRGQIVSAIQAVVESTHVDSQRMIHELYDPLQKQVDHVSNRHVADLAKRVSAIEAAADPAAWHDTMQAAAKAFAEAHTTTNHPQDEV